MRNKINCADTSTKERIIDKAFSLFSRKGIKNTSMREIAADCGVSKPVIYYYFKDKDALCEEMVSHMKGLQKSRLQQLVGAKLSFAKFIQNVFAGYLDGVESRKAVGFMLHLHSYMSSHPALERKIHAIAKDEPLEILKQTVAAEVKAGRLPANMRDIIIHLVLANSVYVVLQPEIRRVKIPKTYPADITKAILRAVCYKGENK